MNSVRYFFLFSVFSFTGGFYRRCYLISDDITENTYHETAYSQKNAESYRQRVGGILIEEREPGDLTYDPRYEHMVEVYEQRVRAQPRKLLYSYVRALYALADKPETPDEQESRQKAQKH